MTKCNFPGECKRQGKIENAKVCCDEKACGWQELKPPSKPDIHESICEELTATYRKKNSDYGDSFSKLRSEFGQEVILIRLSDKLERLKSLLRGNKRQVEDESIIDTLMDLSNYAILEIIERKIERGNENE